jgi:hypothetical protein
MTEDDFLLSTIEAMEKTPDEWDEQYRRAAV